ncbi:hypothetical protein [Acetobacter estunensis]|uniref:hypothetical protein n=1 Tax=Acetobacter estunensis TaxID=104097 RepID=UPI001C2D9777|nr:hypothetical protein [Acetobacter estunensis]MBV1835625.1 hypothetical protein [Acetobacter estunensis]MBV1836114.1 hypothetical protein [Acetobacter estunensis]
MSAKPRYTLAYGIVFCEFRDNDPPFPMAQAVLSLASTVARRAEEIATEASGAQTAHDGPNHGESQVREGINFAQSMFEDIALNIGTRSPYEMPTDRLLRLRFVADELIAHRVALEIVAGNVEIDRPGPAS